MSNRTMYSALVTFTGVLLGIKASMGGIRLDWAECLLVGGVVLMTLGFSMMIEAIKGGFKDGNKSDDH